MYRRLEAIRTLQFREAELYRQLKHSFADVPDLLERIRWAVIGNIYAAFSLAGHCEYWCDSEGEAVMFNVAQSEPQAYVPKEPGEPVESWDDLVPL